MPHRAEEVEAALGRLRVTPSKGRGQSFLVDPFVADAEAALLASPPGTPALEIGGGLGILTEALLRRGVAPLTVVERDPALASFLARTFGDRATVVTGDARTIDLPPVQRAAGNLPYSVATPILLRLLARRIPRIVVLLQREVAERIAAPPGGRSYGRLSIVARLYGEPELFRSVGPEAFWPRPEVESRLLVHTARSGPLPVPSVPRFELAVRTLFSARRKQLGNLLPRLVASRSDAARLAARAGWPDDWATRRPEELAPEAFFALARALGTRPAPT